MDSDSKAQPTSVETTNPVAKLLVWSTGQCARHPVPVLVIAVLLFVVSVGVAARWLTFEGDRGALISSSDPLYALQERFVKEFPQSDDVVVLVQGATAATREKFIRQLATLLKLYPQDFHHIFPEVDLPFLKSGALYYLDVQSLKRLIASLKDAAPILHALSSSSGLTGLLSGFTSSMNGKKSGLESMLPFLNEVLHQLLVSLQTRGSFEYHSPWGALFFKGQARGDVPSDLRKPGQTKFYMTMDGGLAHLLLLRLRTDEGKAIPTLRRLVSRLEKAYPQLQVGVTGSQILDYDEMRSSREDSTRSAILSLILVSALFAFSFREVYRPLMAIFSLIIGVGWTLGFTTVAVGHLNLLTVTFATILIGLGIDFGIHFLYRYEEEMERGVFPLPAMQRTMAGTGLETLVGAFSTAVAFWAVAFTGFKGVAEIGIIAGTGVLLCYLSMTTVLVSMVLWQDGNRVPNELKGPRTSWLESAEAWVLRRAPQVTVAAVAFSLWCDAQLPFVHFDYNLLRLQDQSLDSVQAERQLIQSGGKTELFAVSLADSVAQARKLTKRYDRLPAVAYADSLAPLIPQDVARKTPLIRRIRDMLKGIDIPRHVVSSQSDQNLESLAGGFLDMESAFHKAYPRLIHDQGPETRREAIRFKHLLDRFFATLEGMGPGPIEDGLTAFENQFFGDLRHMVRFLQAQRPRVPVTLETLPENLKVRNIGTTGDLAVRVYPAANIWNHDALVQFVRQVRTVDPDVVGAPIMILYHTTQLRNAFETAGIYALIASCIILLLDFRSLRTAALALTPLLLGILWMIGAMRYFGIQFNPANFMGLPLILGIGLDYGIHVVHRAIEEGNVAMFNHSTGPATALSALTTIAGFGTMMTAGNQGIASLGFVLTAGVTATMITSLVVLPAALRLIKLPELHKSIMD